MQTKHFEYIRAIAEYGSISRAAENLFISQQALSEKLRILEEELEFKIFERSNKGITVTAEGEQFLADLERIMPIIEGWKQLSRANHKKTIKVYLQHSISDLLVNSNLIDEAERECQCIIEWEAERAYKILEKLQQEPEQMGVMALFREGDAKRMIEKLVDKHNFVADKLLDVSMVIVLRCEDDMAQKDELTTADLVDKTYVCNRGFEQTPISNRLCQYTENKQLILPDTVDILSYVAQHRNVFSYMPIISVRDHIRIRNKELVVRQFQDDSVCEVYCVHQKQNDNAFKQVSHMLHAYFQSF